MPETIHNSDGADTTLTVTSGDVLNGTGGASTTIYDENGAGPLFGPLSLAGYQYFRVHGDLWQEPATNGVDTLIGGDGADFVSWDSATSAGLNLDDSARDRLSLEAKRTIEIYELRGGDDIVNMSFLDDGGGPGALLVSFTVYGGLGNDILALGAGDDVLYGGDAAGANIDSSGGDLLYGGAGNDFLFGDGGLDTLYGGSGDDTIGFNADAEVAAGGSVRTWEGDDFTPTALIFDASSRNFSADTYFGDDGVDTLVMSAGDDVLTSFIEDIDADASGSFLARTGARLTGIEVVLLGAGADLVALNHLDTGNAGDANDGLFSDITVAGEAGSDTIAGGFGNDLVIGGDLNGGASNEADLLFGGAGDDVLWGDDLNDPVGQAVGGNDTLYGGTGYDTLYGGGGDDLLVDYTVAGRFQPLGGADVYGGAGADTIVMRVASADAQRAIDGGPDDASDGNDHVVITGYYSSITAALGGGDDVYIAPVLGESGEAGSGSLIDIVDGGSGNDAIAGWEGADTLYGGSDTDVLWGGADSDVIYGGAGTDFIYAEEGDDTIYGGADWDMIYFGRNDGNDQYYDLNRETGSGPQDNWLVVYGVFNQEETPDPEFEPEPDFLRNGWGIYEGDRDLSQPIDFDFENPTPNIAYAHQVNPEAAPDDPDYYLWQLDVVDANFSGTSSMTFDRRDVAGIGLWDNDRTDGHVVQVYLWNEETGSYAFSYAV